MNRFKNGLLAAAVALLIAQSLAFTNVGQALAQQLHEVLVVNTSANPVPVASRAHPTSPSTRSTVPCGSQAR